MGASERGGGRVDDADGCEAGIGCGVPARYGPGETGIGWPRADDRNGLALSGELRCNVSEELAGGGGVRGEELV